MQATDPHAALAREADRQIAAGDNTAAIAWLRQAVATQPDFFVGWLRLGKLLYAEKQYAGAVHAVRACERSDPLATEFQRIQDCMQRLDVSQAGQIALKMLEKCPGHPRAIFTLAHIRKASGDPEACVEILLEGIEQSPANLVLRGMLVGAQEDTGAYRNAIASARHIVEIEESFDSLSGLISVLLRYGLNDEALKACERAKVFCTGDRLRQSEIELARGQLLRILGKTEQSVAAFRACLERNPANSVAWSARADFKTYAFSQADLRAMEAILAAPRSDPSQKSMAAFALARASETNEDWNRCMDLYRQANALHPGKAFDPQRFYKAVGRLVRSFTPLILQHRAAASPEGPIPIFIVGLPRSGSTLLEQILASHSEIEGTLELPVLPAIKRKAHLLCLAHHNADYLEAVGDLSASDLAELGQTYLDEAALFRHQCKAFFTDKLPHNFEHVGLIHKIMPEAKIIDIRRNPLDCGFSCFKQRFTRGSEFSCNLGHIGAYYNGYLTIMDHWDAVLPERVHHIQYEDLVRSPESEIRRLLDYLGLPFEARCLDFHATRRAVRSASSEQVRQPVNTDAIGVWRNVEPHLKDLVESLGPQTLQRFRQYLG